jgi:hypothetical protein
MTRALIAMCGHAEGKQMCELFGLNEFVPASTSDYAEVIKLWRGKR